jgi:phytoene desaturase
LKKQVVVIGAGLGGLSAAIHARLLGHDVLVLEQHDRPGGKASAIDEAGYRLDPGPSIIILLDIYDRVFRSAGRKVEDYLEFSRLDPFTRVYFEGDEPLDLPAGRAECLAVLQERFPEDAKSFDRLMVQIDKVIGNVHASVFSKPYDQPWHLLDRNMMAIGRALGIGRKYKPLIDSWFKSPLIRAFFYGFPSYGGQTYDSVAPGALFIPYLMVTEGVFYPKGGVAAIPEAFHRLAQELGVEFRFNTPVKALKCTKGKIASVQTEEEELSCDAVISNVDRYTTGQWLGRTYTQSPSLSYFTIHWGVRKLYDGLSHHTLFVPKSFEQGFETLYRQRRFPDPPIVYLNATHLEDPTTAPVGSSNLFAVVTSPAMVDGLDWRQGQASAKDSVKRTMGQFGFDVSDSDLDFERVQTPTYFQEQHGNYRGSLYGPDEKFRLFGMMPLRNWDEEVSNLFYCGGSVQPGAGLPMVTLSGKFAAERLDRM